MLTWIIYCIAGILMSIFNVFVVIIIMSSVALLNVCNVCCFAVLIICLWYINTSNMAVNMLMFLVNSWYIIIFLLWGCYWVFCYWMNTIYAISLSSISSIWYVMFVCMVCRLWNWCIILDINCNVYNNWVLSTVSNVVINMTIGILIVIN
jgi:hypothetical protein